MNSLLYISTVLIWGSTWLAIAWQVGEVAVPVSVFYRFLIAALVLLAGLTLLRRRQALHTRTIFSACCRGAVSLV